MIQKRKSALALLASVGMLLAACGAATPTAVPPKPTEPPKPTAAPPTTAPAAAPTAAPTTPAKPTDAPKPAAVDYKIGMILVGPPNDGGWNQAHVDAATYVQAKVPGVKFDFVDKVNPADRPNVKGTQVADDLIAKGAKMIIFNSDDFKDDALETAKKYPNIPVIHASGDYSWKDGAAFKNQPNLANIMGQMEYGKMIGGCAAALNTQTGKIAYIGPLINEETRRLVSSAYLGAKYCWETYRGKKASELQFKVTWIGFWFNIPGVTLDPTKVMNEFINGGSDVTISGLDTPEAAQETKKAAAAGKKVKFVHYDLKTGCDLAPDQCLGSPYFNWGPEYVKAIKAALDGKFNNYPFVWAGPDWKDINNADTSMVGFAMGKGLGDTQKQLDTFIKGLADGSINLWKGPLKYQDGADFVKDGATATPKQIWYMEQLLQGIDGKSK